MSRLTQEASEIVAEIGGRYGISNDAVTTLLIAVANGNGMQAQFNHPELGGMGQWSNGGMTMVGDMFNNALKATVDGLCTELSRLVAGQNVFVPNPQAGSQSQQSGTSLFVAGSGQAAWPDDLGLPSAIGAQNSMRYGVFPAKRRLAIDIGGRIDVYDTGDHQISGVSQQQSGDQSLTFTSQHGLVRVADLPKISASSTADPVTPPVTKEAEPEETFASVASTPTAHEARPAADTEETIALIRKLADLKEGGILTEAEFETKKAELLSRLQKKRCP